MWQQPPPRLNDGTTGEAIRGAGGLLGNNGGVRMKTLVIQIGNTDDKLTQAQWSAFVLMMKQEAILRHGKQVHFFGGSTNWERWQNVAWIVECEPENIDALKAAVLDVRTTFGQDSAAWTEGETEFV
jgi:hypothetical protein